MATLKKTYIQEALNTFAMTNCALYANRTQNYSGNYPGIDAFTDAWAYDISITGIANEDKFVKEFDNTLMRRLAFYPQYTSGNLPDTEVQNRTRYILSLGNSVDKTNTATRVGTGTHDDASNVSSDYFNLLLSDDTVAHSINFKYTVKLENSATFNNGTAPSANAKIDGFKISQLAFYGYNNSNANDYVTNVPINTANNTNATLPDYVSPLAAPLASRELIDVSFVDGTNQPLPFNVNDSITFNLTLKWSYDA